MNKNNCFTFGHVFFFLPSCIYKLFNVHTNETKVDCQSFLENVGNSDYFPTSAKVFDEKFKGIMLLILRRFESHDLSC